MNATENTKTPSLTVYFNKDVTQTLENVRKLAFSKLIWIELDDLIVSINIYHRQQLDLRENKFYEWFNKLISSDYEGASVCVRLQLDVNKLWRHQIKLSLIVKRIQQELNCQDKLYFVYSHESQGILDVWVNDECIPDLHSILQLKEASKLATLINDDNKTLYYINKVVLPNILNIHLSGVEGVKDCYYTLTKGEWRIDTKGGKLKSLLAVGCVDGTKCRSNDMHEVYNLLGIEAVKQFLRDEFGSLIKVNPRHLELLIDSMTVSGGIQRVSRNGIDRKQVGTIAKASFEQPVDNFLISASIGEKDPLKGVSAAITVGKLSEVGTGFMDLFVDPILLQKYQAEVMPEKPQVDSSLMNVNFDDIEVEEEAEQMEIEEYEY